METFDQNTLHIENISRKSIKQNFICKKSFPRTENHCRKSIEEIFNCKNKKILRIENFAQNSIDEKIYL